ncbi:MULTISPECIES: hypothetical protein [unclassified Spirosoma]|uniref:hypothetical protein n=1 Tax=unclassified Spirosoma TaxID=2621999 RepID=UPI000A4890BE|nr:MULTISPECIES: hypothetical protein [unclassified Spirosoma]MBN8823896.1 hypothetical protein [Spirosoma sp.]
MTNQRDQLREMRRLLASGRADDRKKAKDILASIGRHTKQVKKEAGKQQTSLFD